ncbi:MAG: hypothetical protein ACOYK8_07485 [Alphaproteobacteria bacterium]
MAVTMHAKAQAEPLSLKEPLSQTVVSMVVRDLGVYKDMATKAEGLGFLSAQVDLDGDGLNELLLKPIDNYGWCEGDFRTQNCMVNIIKITEGKAKLLANFKAESVEILPSITQGFHDLAIGQWQRKTNQPITHERIIMKMRWTGTQYEFAGGK